MAYFKNYVFVLFRFFFREIFFEIFRILDQFYLLLYVRLLRHKIRDFSPKYISNYTV